VFLIGALFDLPIEADDGDTFPSSACPIGLLQGYGLDNKILDRRVLINEERINSVLKGTNFSIVHE
jgi:hypothetical protein